METQNQWMNASKEELNGKYDEISKEMERVEVELVKSDWYKKNVNAWRETQMVWSIDDLLGLKWDTFGDDDLENPPCLNERLQLANNLVSLNGLLVEFHEEVWESVGKMKCGGEVEEIELIICLAYKLALEKSCGLLGRLMQDEVFKYQPND